jgi:hypothetical protein
MVSCLKKNAPHIGPLYWLPDKCCLIPGHEPAASPSFLHTTLKKKRNIRSKPSTCPLPQKCLCVSKGNTGGAKMDAKTRDKIST